MSTAVESAEASRSESELARVQAEVARQATFENNETTRQETFIQSELTRAQAELDRQAQEEARETAEGERVQGYQESQQLLKVWEALMTTENEAWEVI